jgi:quinol monooxygenase YgiN
MRSLFLLLFTASALAAQAPATDTQAHAVAYVDVMPASKSAAVTAFKQYRDASRKEEGFVQSEMFEQMGRPGHFSIIQAWANAKALDAHLAGAAMKEWRSKLDLIRLSDYDQRPYKGVVLSSALSVAPATFVITHVDIGGQGTNAAELLRRLAEESRKETGNMAFVVLQHAMRANHFTVIEGWQDQKALDAHAAASHTRQYRDSLGPIAGSPLDERIYQRVP